MKKALELMVVPVNIMDVFSTMEMVHLRMIKMASCVCVHAQLYSCVQLFSAS